MKSRRKRSGGEPLPAPSIAGEFAEIEGSARKLFKLRRRFLALGCDRGAGPRPDRCNAVYWEGLRSICGEQVSRANRTPSLVFQEDDTQPSGRVRRPCHIESCPTRLSSPPACVSSGRSALVPWKPSRLFPHETRSARNRALPSVKR